MKLKSIFLFIFLMCTAIETFSADLEVDESSAKRGLIAYLKQIKTTQDLARVLGDDFESMSYRFRNSTQEAFKRHYSASKPYICVPNPNGSPEISLIDGFINSQQGRSAQIKIFWSIVGDPRYPLLTTGYSFTFEVTKVQ
jgi:hypothetical protein